MSGIFNPNLYIKTVAIVGVGGTGAQVARIVGRSLYDMRRARKHIPQIVLIDPDTVEKKNFGRQLFSPSVLGMPKAEVVGRMLNLALGLDVRWIVDGVDPVKHFDRYGGNLVISCVDNYEARRAIHQISGTTIAAGNHRETFQVCIGNADDPDRVRRFIEGQDGKFPYLPKEGLLFPELLQPEPAIELSTPEPGASCSDLIALGEQHLLVNDLAATIVGQYVYRMLHRLPVRSFLTYGSIGEFPTLRSLPISREELSAFV